MARFSKPWIDHLLLLDEWLPAVPEIQARCSTGHAGFRRAQERPRVDCVMLGTCGMPEATARELCLEAGFSELRRMPVDDPFNALYAARPWADASGRTERRVAAAVRQSPLPDSNRRAVLTMSPDATAG